MLEFIFFLVLYTFPLHWAAGYSDAADSNYIKCFILGIVSSVIYTISLFVFYNSLFLGGLLTTVIVITIFMKVLKIPSSNFLMFAIMLAFLNLLTRWAAVLIVNGIFGTSISSMNI